MSNSVNFSSLLVRTADNTVDLDATRERVLNALDAFLAANGKLSDEISAAVMSAFNVTPKGTMLFIVNHALKVLAPSPDNYAIVEKKIREYVQVHSGSHDNLSALFYSAKGRNGGTQLWTDELRAKVAKEEAEAAAEEAVAEAKKAAKAAKSK